MSDQIQEIIVDRYDDDPTCKANLGTSCTMTFNVATPIAAPVYVYYQLDNFYQNHRRYVKSRSFNQLKGDYINTNQLADCDPIKLNKDLGRVAPNNKAVDKITILPDNDPAIPCGLVAKSFFTDTYEILDP